MEDRTRLLECVSQMHRNKWDMPKELPYKHMINPRISAVWSTTKPIAPFSCTPCVQVVHTKAEIVHLTPGLLGLEVLFNCHA